MPKDDSLLLGFNFDDEDDHEYDDAAPGSPEDDDLADAESNADENEVDYHEASYNPSNSQSRGVSLAPASELSNPRNRTRANGQIFAEQRPISADLDSTDELIISLKDGGYSNEQVSAALVREGRINYDKKTVGSRYLRLKNAILEREEKRLDGELTDWHDGEDEALLRADELALAEIKNVIARTKAKRWHLVAKNLQKILRKETKYSAGTCRKRFVALQSGTATIPPELDDDPARRQEEKAARVLAALHDQKLKDATEKQEKEASRLARDNIKLQKALEKKERAEKRAKVAEEKAREALEQASKREEKAKQLEIARQAQADQIRILQQGKNATTPTAKPSAAAVKAKASAHDTASSDTPPPRNKIRTIDCPRWRMTLKELKAECGTRGLSQSGTKAAIVQRLASDDSTMSMAHLQSFLKARKASTEGSRVELVARLAQADAGASEWGRKFAKGTSNLQSTTASSSKRDASTGSDVVRPKRMRVFELIENRSISPFSVHLLGSRTQSMAPIAKMGGNSPATTRLRRSASCTPFDITNSFLDFGNDDAVGAGIGIELNEPDLANLLC